MGQPEQPIAVIRYTIDSSDHIVSIAGPWSSFALTNDASDLANPDCLIGSSIWDFLDGLETKSLYRQVFQDVRLRETKVVLPFRCDSPEQCRELELSVAYDGENRLIISSTQNAKADRDYVSLLDSNQHRGTDYIDCCSVCRRFSSGSGLWVDAEEFLQSTRILASPNIPVINERVCDECADTVGVNYLISQSGVGSGAGEKVPLVVFLHGASHQRHLMRLYAPPRLVAQGKLMDVPPFVLLSPLNNTNHMWDIDYVADLIEHCCTEYNIDRNRIYVTGVSAGGTAIWRMLARYPRLFAAAIPIASVVNLLSTEATQTPIWAVHGVLDKVALPGYFVRRMENLSGSHTHLKWTFYKDRDHDAWSLAYRQKEIWKWLFSQSLETQATV
jgi:predicted esterase